MEPLTFPFSSYLQDRLLTLKRLIRAFVSILIGMCEQTEFPVGFLYIRVRRRLLQPQYLIEGCSRAFPYSDNCNFLFHRVLPVLVALIMISILGTAVWRCVCAGRRSGGHSRVNCALSVQLTTVLADGGRPLEAEKRRRWIDLERLAMAGLVSSIVVFAAVTVLGRR